MSTDERDVVLDPFSGTGTTAIAAKRLGRNYIGFELDREYVRIARRKLNRELPNSKIGNAWVSLFLDGVASVRDVDWEELSRHYIIPIPVEQIDHTAILLGRRKQQGCICPPQGNKKSKLVNNQLKFEEDSLL